MLSQRAGSNEANCNETATMALLRPRSALGPSLKLGLRSFSSEAVGAGIPDSWRNPAAVLHGIDDIRFQDMPLPDQVADGHVRVQMRAVGICGSDVHYYKKVRHFRKPNAATGVTNNQSVLTLMMEYQPVFGCIPLSMMSLACRDVSATLWSIPP